MTEASQSGKPRAISLAGCAFALAWAVLATFLFGDAGSGFIGIFVALAYAFIWLLNWAGRCSRRDRAASAALWSFEPIAFLLVAAFAYSGSLLLARLYLSAPALERYALDVNAGKVDLNFEFSHPLRWVGLYSISVTETLPSGGARFITSGDGLFDKAGFAYSPNGEPPARVKNSYTHLYGPWWQWKQHF